MNRITHHPVLDIPEREQLSFTFNGRKITAYQGEVITSALIASDIHIFSHHHKDGAPQGMYCANGQCSQCMVIADGVPVKGCMTRVRPGMEVVSCEGRFVLPEEDQAVSFHSPRVKETECLIIGGGPAGLSAACELGKAGVATLVVDDKHDLGGKLTLQTHTFFGSRDDCYAGRRGIEIAGVLEEEAGRHQSVEVWVNSPAVGVFNDGRVGVVRDGVYTLVKPKTLLVAAGAREKSLAFPGCDLPGVYGAGAFQTLVNRDLVVPSKKLFILGGGNVGLIVGYHAVQAGIEVAGLAELLPACGGYKVHADKLRRLGVPLFTSHTILSAAGTSHLDSITICEVDDRLKPIPGMEKTFQVDTLLVAVGLSPVDEMYRKALESGLDVYAAGDAEEISEASAALVSGRVRGQQIVEKLTRGTALEAGWEEKVQVYRKGPGKVIENKQASVDGGIYPVIWCSQEIPCDPCRFLCPRESIHLKGDQLMGIPEYQGNDCTGCGRCVLECPGLAIVLVDETRDPSRKTAVVTLPYELQEGRVLEGDEIVTTGYEGNTLGTGKVISIRPPGRKNKRALLLVNVPYNHRLFVAGFRLKDAEGGKWETLPVEGDETIVCRCERVARKEIVDLIRAGYRDMNQIKACLRTGMGACGGKTCRDLILAIFREEGIPREEITPFTYRPPELEIPLGTLIGEGRDE